MVGVPPRPYTQYNAAEMGLWSRVAGLALATLVGACAQSEREWMKVDQSYTVEEFRRDVRECTRSGALDEDCMKRRGWVSLNPRPEKPAELDPRTRRY
jgi:hypothetical protein